MNFWKNSEVIEKISNTLSIEDADPEDYDGIFMAGGWGAAWDLKTSDALAKFVSNHYANNKPIGAVCHGPLGMINAVKPNGDYILNGIKCTAVTD